MKNSFWPLSSQQGYDLVGFGPFLHAQRAKLLAYCQILIKNFYFS